MVMVLVHYRLVLLLVMITNVPVTMAIGALSVMKTTHAALMGPKIMALSGQTWLYATTLTDSMTILEMLIVPMIFVIVTA